MGRPIVRVLDYRSLADALELGPEHACWRDELCRSDGWRDPATDLHRADVAARCAHLAVPPAAVPAVLDTWDAVTADPALRRLFDHCRWRFYGRRTPAHTLYWPMLPAALGEPGRLLYVLVLLAGVDAVRARHAATGIPADVSRATLADAGQQLAIYRRIHGTWGFDELGWLALHWHDRLFRLGRLQFQRSTLWFPLADGAPLAPGEPVLDLHVPEDGPLDPDACERSLAWAADFFPRCFPAERYRATTLLSWLLAPALRDYLAPTSNILRFQRRFTPLPLSTPIPGAVFKFVFRHPTETPSPDALATLPQRTAVERAIVAHVRAGGTWDAHAGYLLG